MQMSVDPRERTDASRAPVVVSDSLRFEHHRAPLGIGEARPRLSWTTRCEDESWTQTAYELEISVFDNQPGVTTRVESASSVLVAWPPHAPALVSGQRCRARVRVWGSSSPTPSEWSSWAWVEAGLLEPDAWVARAVSPPLVVQTEPPAAAPLFRREFVARAPISRARLYATAHGVYEIELNGTRVGDDVLAPGWTSYSHRLRYQTYDVTGQVKEGPNALGAMVADGWYRGTLGWHGGVTNLYGDRLALIAQLEIRYVDGSTDVISTDQHWRCAQGPITSTGLYEGERYDARLEPRGWSSPGFVDAKWRPVYTLVHDPLLLTAPSGPPMRRVETLRPVSAKLTAAGTMMLDFGQNISGRLRIRVQGAEGQTIQLRHAEVLDGDQLALRPLRHATALDEYTLAGDGIEIWEPRFTTHGFRYAEVAGWPGELHDGAIEALVCHTDMRRTGWFSCSDPALNQLHDNVVWSMRGNFADVPTDCPQRDERLGWTGDIQVFAPTASFLYDCAGFLTSWLADLAAEQKYLGTVPHYVPWVPLTFDLAPAAVWGDAAVLVPWVLYERSGDIEILRVQYPSMVAWVDQVTALAGEKHLWDTGFQFRDWLDPTAPPDRPDDARTDRYLVATAYHARTAQVLSDVAGVLGHDDDQRRYADLAGKVRVAFADEYVAPSGRISSDSQTAYALALAFDLLPTAAQRRHAGDRLAQLAAEEGYRIATGFVGTPLICDALSSVGAFDTAYHLLNQRECPSWLYPVTMGATTIWERWDSLLPDGTVNPGGMTSFNHYALGAVADWLHRTVAGLAPAAPGYRRILVCPRPGGGLTNAAATHLTPFGAAAVEWTRVGRAFRLTVTVPPGTTASVQLPDPAVEPVDIGSGTHTFSCEFRDPSEDPPIPPQLNMHSQPIDEPVRVLDHTPLLDSRTA